MTCFKYKVRKLGGHVHVDLFVGKSWQQLAKSGELVFAPKEWEDFSRPLSQFSWVRVEYVGTF